jgi:predicted KAP-like P-loop ATPase
VSTPKTHHHGTPNDDPILDNEDSPDLLGRSDFADSAAAVIDRLRQNESSSVIAMIGAWGSGKSSMLNMLRRRISQPPTSPEKGWIIVDFNPWYYSDLQSLQAGFFRELTAALPVDQRWTTARSTIASIGKATAPLTSVFSILGLDPSQAIDKAAELIGGDQSVSALHSSANKALLEVGQPVLMVLDDLDRLSPDELLMVFKLLRLTGRLKNVHYLVSYDEESLLDILSRTGLVGESDAARAVEYLEKMVQVRLDLPPLRESQIAQWLDKSIMEFATGSAADPRNANWDRFGSAFDKAARTDLSTPRSIHRFISQAQAFLPGNVEDLDFEDYLILTWMRSSRPLLFTMLRKYKDELVHSGRPNLQQNDDKDATKEKWKARLRAAQTEEEMLERIGSVLSDLFPRFEKDWNTGVGMGPADATSPPRIGNADYFDRYFNFGVPVEDISDVSVRLGYEQIIGGTGGQHAAALETQLASNARLAITKISSLIQNQVSIPAPLVEWLGGVDSAVPVDYGILTPHRQLRRLGGDAFLRVPPSELESVASAVLSTQNGVSVLSDWLRLAKKNPQGRSVTKERSTALEDVHRLYLQTVEEYFYSMETLSPLDVPSDRWYLIWEWYEASNDQVREFLKQKLMYDQWSVLDLVARLVSTGYTSGLHGQFEVITGLDLNIVDDVLTLDFVYRNLSQEIAEAESPPWSHHSVEANNETRKSYALQVLKAGRQDSGFDVSEN